MFWSVRGVSAVLQKHILSRAFCHRQKVAVIQNISCPSLGISEVKPVYTPLALRDWFRAAPRNPQRSKPKASGRWLRSLRDHNHRRVVWLVFFGVKVRPLRGRRWRTLTPKMPDQREGATPKIPVRASGSLDKKGIVCMLLFFIIFHIYVVNL